MSDGLLDLSAQIDSLISEFPGNITLQSKLGIYSPEFPPYETLSDIPWHTIDDIGLVRGGSRMLIELIREIGAVNEHCDSKISRLLDEYMACSNRLLLLELIGRSDYTIITGYEQDVVRIYIELAITGYEQQLDDIMNRFHKAATENIIECEKLRELLKR